MALERKLTLAGLVGKIDIKVLLAQPGEKMDLAIIRGMALRYKPDQTAIGDFVRFFGRFRGTNMITGEMIDAPQMIAPKVIEDMLFGAIGPDGEKEVAFAFKIGVHYDGDAVTKYVYDFESLVELAEDDPLSRMDRMLAGTLDALPKPQQKTLTAPINAGALNAPPASEETKRDTEAEEAAAKERAETTARVNQRASGGRRR